jgi:hypothetical protein
MALAAANGQTATMDPTIQQLLADIRQATGTTGSVTPLANPLHEQYTYNLLNERTTGSRPTGSTTTSRTGTGSRPCSTGTSSARCRTR